MVQKESGESRLCDVSHIQQQTGYKNILKELAHLYSILEAVLPRIGKQTRQMWMKSLAAKFYTHNALQEKGLPGHDRLKNILEYIHQIHQGLLQEKLKYE